MTWKRADSQRWHYFVKGKAEGFIVIRPEENGKWEVIIEHLDGKRQYVPNAPNRRAAENWVIKYIQNHQEFT